MASAEIITPDGLKLKVSGTPEEVAKIVQLAQLTLPPASGEKATKRSSAKAKKGLPALISVLRNEKFFGGKRELADVTRRLAEMGSHYSGDTVGKQLLREVRARRLRRLKEGGSWVYVE